MYQTGNVDILTLKQLLGHSSVGTTQIYTHLQEFRCVPPLKKTHWARHPAKSPAKHPWIQQKLKQGRAGKNCLAALPKPQKTAQLR